MPTEPSESGVLKISIMPGARPFQALTPPSAPMDQPNRANKLVFIDCVSLVISHGVSRRSAVRFNGTGSFLSHIQHACHPLKPAAAPCREPATSPHERVDDRSGSRPGTAEQ